MTPHLKTRHRSLARSAVTAALSLALLASCGAALKGQAGTRPIVPAGAKQLTIPYLANDTRPSELDFAAAICDVAAGGQQMDCRFRQVFITVTSMDATACAITTNSYEQTFRRDTASRWIRADAPVGDCGIVESTTLEDGGTTRWTMTIGKRATMNAERADCRAATAAEPDVYSWRNVKRPLPCATVQPGAIER